MRGFLDIVLHKLQIKKVENLWLDQVEIDVSIAG